MGNVKIYEQIEIPGTIKVKEETFDPELKFVVPRDLKKTSFIKFFKNYSRKQLEEQGIAKFFGVDNVERALSNCNTYSKKEYILGLMYKSYKAQEVEAGRAKPRKFPTHSNKDVNVKEIVAELEFVCDLLKDTIVSQEPVDKEILLDIRDRLTACKSKMKK